MLDISQDDSDLEPAIGSLNLGFIEDLYGRYLRDPHSVSADWRRYFKRLGNGSATPPRVTRSATHCAG